MKTQSKNESLLTSPCCPKRLHTRYNNEWFPLIGCTCRLFVTTRRQRTHAETESGTIRAESPTCLAFILHSPPICVCACLLCHFFGFFSIELVPQTVNAVVGSHESAPFDLVFKEDPISDVHELQTACMMRAMSCPMQRTVQIHKCTAIPTV
jgi:hypothetical protein